MATSLEDLLARDGFQGRKSFTMSRSSFQSGDSSFMRHSLSDRKKNLSRDKFRIERTMSDTSQYNMRGESPVHDKVRSTRPRNDLVRRHNVDAGLKEGRSSRLGLRNSNNIVLQSKTSCNIVETSINSEIVEVGDEENEVFKDIYSNDMSETVTTKYCSNESKHKSNELILGHMSFNNSSSESLKEFWTSHDRTKTQKHDKSFSKLALGEVAIQATISIISGYIKRFLKNEDFRIKLRYNCLSLLNFIELQEGEKERKIIDNLEQAIETIENIVEQKTTTNNTKDLKKIVLQLSVIVGLNSNDFKDGFTLGVPNYKLSAFAHLYLSVVYKLQKKDRVSAKHLLQVFCDSPFEARTMLLPDLWDYLFSPHLSHLKVWYNQEAESLADTPRKQRKIKLLEKVYNETLDSSTCKFAIYYKDWLTSGLEAPSNIPQINIPKIEIESSHGHSSELSSPNSPLSTQPMVSKILYDDVFGKSSKLCHDEAEDINEIESRDDCARSSNGSETVKDQDQDIEENSIRNSPNNAFFSKNGNLKASEQNWSIETVVQEKDLNGNYGNLVTCQESKKVVSKENEASSSHSLTKPTKVRSSFEGLQENFEEKLSFLGIPEDFICPLTGKLFEDPVTLETGHTFEREAIKQWFDERNKTCPITGKQLDHISVPSTNLVLKRVVHNWKSKQSKLLFELASKLVAQTEEDGFDQNESETTLSIMEQLLTAFRLKEEHSTDVKHLISIGGLQFLLKRFEYGKLDERASVAEILFYCIEVDSVCRNKIAREINKQCLLELLYSNHVRSIKNGVMLLAELICLNRKKDIAVLLSSLQIKGIKNTMDALLVCLQSSPPSQRPLIAIILLFMDLLVEPLNSNIYRDKAVDTIIEALHIGLTDHKIRENCCKALLMLGGRFSFSGKILTESWILKQAGFSSNQETHALDNVEDRSNSSSASWVDDEEQKNEEWLRNLASILIDNGKSSFLEAISKPIHSRSLELERACLVTLAWLSKATSPFDVEFKLSKAFSPLIYSLKDTLQKANEVEHKIFASMALLNFSKIPECKELLMEMRDDFASPLRRLSEVTWTAKMLCTIISEDNL